MIEISIIVPVYKVEDCIHRCIDSICSQTFKNFELILVDDCSPDRSGDICDEYALKDNRIKVIHLKKNGGQAAARNLGIATAKGKYINFIDSDDYVHPKFLEILHKNIKKYDADISICDYKLVYNVEPIYEAITVSTARTYEGLEALGRLYSEKRLNYIPPWGKLYKRYLFDDIRYPEGQICEDEAIIHELLYSSAKIVESDEVLYYYYQSAVSTMRGQFNKRRLDALISFERRIRYFDEKKISKYYKQAVKEYLNFIIYNYPSVIDILKYEKLARDLKGKFKKYFYNNKRRCGFSRKSEPQFYEFMHPRIVLFFTRMSNLYRTLLKGGFKGVFVKIQIKIKSKWKGVTNGKARMDNNH